jgi:signal transduction histidine kinase/DNA-binding response OmpR family regulator/ligand-binding sensor domain-containing protein
MWFGTYDGLNLFNGKDITVFRPEPDNQASLLGSSIYSILDAEPSFLWVTTQLGVNKFSLKERKVVESFPDYKKTELIVANTQGDAWLISKEDHLSFYDKHRKRFDDIYMSGISPASVKDIFMDASGELNVISTDGILKRIAIETKTGEYQLKIEEERMHDQAFSIAIFQDGIIYFVDASQHLFQYDVAEKTKKAVRNIRDLINRYGQFHSIALFRNDIYIAFTHNGLIRLNSSEHYRPELINMDNGIFCILEDKNQDALWVGGDGNGVELLYKEKDKFGHILLESLPFVAKKPIRTFFTDKENSLWFGTKGDGIIRVKDYDRFNHLPVPASNVQRFAAHDGLYKDPVFSFAQSRYRPEDLWIGTNGGVRYYSYSDSKMYPLRDNDDGKPVEYVHSLCETNDSTLWLATVGGGVRQIVIDKTVKPYRIKRKQTYLFHKDNNLCNEFYSMIYDGDSTLIAGSRGGYGVIRFNIYTKTHQFISMNNAENKAIGDVLCMYKSKDSLLYIGASSGLTIIRLSSSGENVIKQFNRKNGIVNDMIHGILEDNAGFIWLSTNKGLVKYNPQNDSFYNYQSPKIGVVEFSDDAYWRCPITGRLFFGGVNGLVWIESQTTDDREAYKPDLSFFEVTLLDGETHTLYDYNGNTDKKLTFPYKNNSFAISFTALDYIDGGNYDFSYKLEDYNADWVALQKNNRIHLTNIPSGDYTLKVRYKNDVVNAGDQIYSLRLKVLPPWYLSIWALAIYLLLFLAALLAVILYIRRKVLKKQQMMAEKIQEEQREKLLESKSLFFTNITHELLTPLTLINGSCEQIIQQAYPPPQGIRKALQTLQKSVSGLNELIQEIIDFRKMEELGDLPVTIKGLPVSEMVNNLLGQFEEIMVQNKIKRVVAIPENLNWNTDRSCFNKIISNLVSNAFKYTPVGGEIRITLSIENDVLKIVVYNTGKGIAPDKIHSIFDRYKILENTDVNTYNQMTSRNGLGLFICHSMTKQLQGDIVVTSELNQYTEFVVQLPKLPVTVTETDSPDLEKPDQLIGEKRPVNRLPAAHRTGKAEIGILVVDDHQEIVELISDVLSPLYHVMKAYSVDEALSQMKQQTPSLIITDIMMPETDGLSFVNKMRHDKYMKHIPVIVISAKIENQDLASGYDRGADAYLTKPFSSKVLLSVVNRLITGKGEMKNYLQTPESAYEYKNGLLLHREDKEFLAAIVDIIDKNMADESLHLEDIADKMNLSSRNLYRRLKQITSVSPSEFIKDYKLSFAANLLISTDLKITEIVYRIGMTNKSYFYRVFAEKYGMPPKEYRETNRPEN